MPYFITDKSPDCSGWATVKEDGTVLGCHQSKQDAVDHMVAVSLAEDMAPGGERNSDADEVIIVDIDGTLIAGGSGIQKNVDYVNSLYPDYYIYIVTGRPESDQEKTMQQLADAGVQFNDIQFNEDMSITTAEYKKQTAADILEQNPVKLAIDNDAAARRAYASLGIATKDPKTIKADEVPSIRQVSLDVPAYIRAAARKGLDYYGQGLAGDGLVDRTVREARDMARGDISEDKVIRANAWGARHLVDLDATKNSNADDKEFPGAGAVAFYLWGINPLDPKPAMDWFMGKAEAIKADQNRSFSFHRIRSDDWANIAPMEEKVETRRITSNDFELRADPQGNGMSFTGYAAVFNSPSEPLPFTERIAPGAFARSLKSKNNVRMYMNHDSNMLLATTRAKTLRLSEDSKGLLVDASLPDTTIGRDLSVLMQRGDVNSMSFGFTVPSGGDMWSDDGQSRELRQIKLFEVSVVTGFPAYTATTATVRSLDALSTRTGIDADQLAAAITTLEAGQTLSQDHAMLLRETVAKLEPVQDTAPARLGVMAKHLDLLKTIA
jgi:HK97 family phage prohead protease